MIDWIDRKDRVPAHGNDVLACGFVPSLLPQVMREFFKSLNPGRFIYTAWCGDDIIYKQKVNA